MQPQSCFCTEPPRSSLALTLVWDTSGELSNPGHCPHLPPVEGGRHLKNSLPLPVIRPPHSGSPTRRRRSLGRRLPAKFRSFSVTFIMDGCLFRSVASTFRKPNAAHSRRSASAIGPSKCVCVCARVRRGWGGGSFLNF